MKKLLVSGVVLSMIFSCPLVAFSDTPLPPPEDFEVWSNNRQYVAVANYAARTTKVFRVLENGNRTKLWNMNGWHRWLALSNDGNYLLIPYEGYNLLSIEYSENEVMLTIVREGTIVKSVKLNQIIEDFTKLKRTVSHYSWGKFLGFNSIGQYKIETIEGNIFTIDLSSEEIKISKQKR